MKARGLTPGPRAIRVPAAPDRSRPVSVICFRFQGRTAVKIKNSLKTAKLRERNCLVIRRKGRVYVINKLHPRYKTRQG